MNWAMSPERSRDVEHLTWPDVAAIFIGVAGVVGLIGIVAWAQVNHDR